MSVLLKLCLRHVFATHVVPAQCLCYTCEIRPISAITRAACQPCQDLLRCRTAACVFCVTVACMHCVTACTQGFDEAVRGLAVGQNTEIEVRARDGNDTDLSARIPGNMAHQLVRFQNG